jgi:hypothetical protein
MEKVNLFWMYTQIPADDHWVRNVENPNPYSSPFFSRDEFRFKIGSGDGTQWVTATLNTPGIAAGVNAIKAALEARPEDPFPDVFPGQNPGNLQGPHTVKYSVVALPCGNGAAVVLVRFEHALAFSGWWSTTEEYPEGNWYTRRTEAYPTITASANDYKCFLVSHRTCRELDMPTVFNAAVQTLFPPIQYNSGYAWTYRPTYGPPFAAGLDPVLDTTVEPEPIFMPGITYSSSYSLDETEAYTLFKPTGGSYQMTSSGIRYIFTTTPVEFTRINSDAPCDYAISDLAFHSFGLKPGLMNDYEGAYYPARGYSPAIFSLFNAQSDSLPGVRSFWQDGNLLYSDYRDLLLELGATPSSSVLCVDIRDSVMRLQGITVENDPSLYTASVDDISRIPFASHKPLLEYTYDTLPLDSAFTKARSLPFSASRVNPYEGEEEKADLGYDDGFPYQIVPHFYTDWGKPAYCRQQLLALGFTAEDLTP